MQCSKIELLKTALECQEPVGYTAENLINYSCIAQSKVLGKELLSFLLHHLLPLLHYPHLFCTYLFIFKLKKVKHPHISKVTEKTITYLQSCNPKYTLVRKVLD